MRIRFSPVPCLAVSATILFVAGCTVYEPPPPSQGAVSYEAPAPVPVYANESDDNVVEVSSVDDFDEPLASYGVWITIGSYGRCWRPAHVEHEWRPYSSGQWVHVEAGWCWQSDEPWGWATYHYGRWVDDSSAGWVWIPETQWAPSWVEWRSGGEYVGLAPLPPRGARREDRDRDFVFVQKQQFVEPIRPNKVIVNNTTVINQTVNITNVNVVNNTTTVNNTVINPGPRVQEIEQATGRKVATVSAVTVRRTQEAPVVRSHPALARRQRVQATQPAATRQAAQPRPIAPINRERPEAQPRITQPQPSNSVTRTPEQPRRIEPTPSAEQTRREGERRVQPPRRENEVPASVSNERKPPAENRDHVTPPPAESVTRTPEAPRRIEQSPAIQERKREQEQERVAPPRKREVEPPAAVSHAQRTEPSETHVRVVPPARSEATQVPEARRTERPTTVEKAPPENRERANAAEPAKEKKPTKKPKKEDDKEEGKPQS